jgi:hypothetical protein
VDAEFVPDGRITQFKDLAVGIAKCSGRSCDRERGD